MFKHDLSTRNYFDDEYDNNSSDVNFHLEEKVKSEFCRGCSFAEDLVLIIMKINAFSDELCKLH